MWTSGGAPCSPTNSITRIVNGVDYDGGETNPVDIGLDRFIKLDSGDFVGRDALALDENMLAAKGAVAFMTPVSELAPGQAAAVYLIQSNGGQ